MAIPGRTTVALPRHWRCPRSLLRFMHELGLADILEGPTWDAGATARPGPAGNNPAISGRRPSRRDNGIKGLTHGRAARHGTLGLPKGSRILTGKPKRGCASLT